VDVPVTVLTNERLLGRDDTEKKRKDEKHCVCLCVCVCVCMYVCVCVCVVCCVCVRWRENECFSRNPTVLTNKKGGTSKVNHWDVISCGEGGDLCAVLVWG
jgi:hypothetical protein